MTIREGIAWGAAVLAVGVCGYFCAELGGQKVRVTSLEQSAAARAGEAKRASAEAAGKTAALESAHAEAERLKTDLEEAGKARAALEARLAEAAKPAPAAAPKGRKRKSQLAGWMEMVRKMSDDPAMREQMRQGILMQLDMMYGDLFKEWGLDGEALEAARNTLADRMMAQMETGLLLMDASVAPEEVLRRQQEIQAASQDALAKALDASRLAALEAYEKGMPAKMLAKQTDTQLAALGLDPAVRERVRDIVVEETMSMQQQVGVQMGMGGDGMGIGGNGGELTLEQVLSARRMFSGEGAGEVGGVLQGMAEARGRILERALPLLTQDQYERFRKQQEAQAQIVEMGVRMMQGEGGE